MEVLIVVAICLVLFAIFLRFDPSVLAKLTAWIKGLGPMNNQVYQSTNQDFNLFSNNIQVCNAVNDENCICEGWPNFPEIFYQDAILNINNPSQQMFLSISGRNLFNATYSNIFEYLSLGLIKKGQIAYAYSLGSGQDYQTNSFNTINISFSKIAEIENENGQSGKYGIISSEYFFKKNLKENGGVPILEIITSSGGDPVILNNEIAVFPVCSNNRVEAITAFNNIINSLASTSSGQAYTISGLPDGYSIFLRKTDKASVLMYNNQAVKNISFVQDTTAATNFWGKIGFSKINIVEFEANEVSVNTLPPCSDSQTTELSNGANIEIKSEGGSNCIYA